MALALSPRQAPVQGVIRRQVTGGPKASWNGPAKTRPGKQRAGPFAAAAGAGMRDPAPWQPGPARTAAPRSAATSSVSLRSCTETARSRLQIPGDRVHYGFQTEELR